MTASVALPVDQLIASVHGTVHLPGTPGYAAAATPWNVAVPPTASVVVVAADADDVVTCVRFARENGLRVAVQATGHGAAPADGPALLVVTSGLDELHVSEAGTARVGAGRRWTDVIEAAAPLGFGALAGSSPEVGVVGFLTGGGMGPVARTFGISADYVTAFDVVTGDGVLRRASAAENRDLFWGLRGGKGALGIVTAVEFDLVTISELLGGCLYFGADDVADVAHVWSQWTATLPEQATTSFAILRLPPLPGVPAPLAGTVVAAVRFAWVGDVAEGRAVLAPMLDVATPVLGGIDVMPYSALGAIHNDPVDPMPIAESATLLSGFPAAAVERLLELAGPQAQCPQVILELRHLGGAIARRPEIPTAFDHRGDAYTLLTVGIAAPPTLEATRAHAKDVLDALADWDTGRSLPNLAGSNDPRQAARKYAPATLARLATLAQTYDPSGVIASAAPIRTAAAHLR